MHIHSSVNSRSILLYPMKTQLGTQPTTTLAHNTQHTTIGELRYDLLVTRYCGCVGFCQSITALSKVCNIGLLR